MRILWLTVDRSHRVAHHFDDFRQAVEDIADVTVLMKIPAGSHGQDMWQLSRNLIDGKVTTKNIVLEHLSKDSNYDYIFCDAFFAYLNEEWDKITIPSAIFIEDVHHPVPKHQIEVARSFKIQTIFHRFNFAFHKFHPEAKIKFNCIWLPHSINMKRYVDEVEKSINVLHVGVSPKIYYPWRHAVKKQLKGKPYFTTIGRPKDVANIPRDGKWPIDKDYDNLLKSSKICITGGSTFNVPVQKYVEIPAAGSVLMSNWFPDLGLLGFRDGENMVVYQMENIVEKVESLLENEDRIKRISESGLGLMLTKHTSEIRSKQFINNICQLLRKPLEFPGITPCSYQVCFNGKLKSEIKVNNNIAPIFDPSLVNEVDQKVALGTDWRARILQAGGKL